MKRISDNFFDILRPWVDLTGTKVLEIGCGDGTYSREIAKRCGALTGIDPDPRAIARARNKRIHKARFEVEFAESMGFVDQFDFVLFMLSFYHITASHQEVAIQNAMKALEPKGRIVFLEPDVEDSPYYEAERLFDAGEGDMRSQHKEAERVIHTYGRRAIVSDMQSKALFRFESAQDFIDSLKPRKNLAKIARFLEKHHGVLTAKRRVIICKPIG